ncbi:MAG TPA: ABC transporter ATP-binding protein [Pirellulales bacterium]|nr:ABC transporter ATP-binding protein [Pirellulales bacterium]
MTNLLPVTPSEPVARSNSDLHSLRVERVTKRFKQGEAAVEALRSVSLSIPVGQFVAVMGASGSGKSTLLHVLAGLTWPDEGRVVIDNTDLSQLSDDQLTSFRRRRIGLVFQAFNLIPTLSARENILLPLLVDGQALPAGRLDSLAERLGIAQRLNHRPDALSGGEQQRVAIARALITDPALVLADEPTGSLDSVSGQKLCRLLRELCHEQRRTIVVVTHEPTVAVWAQRVIVMKDGQVLTEFATRDFHDAHSLAAHYQDIVNAEAIEVTP